MTETRTLLPYEIALLQFRADVTSEEFVNVGVAGFSPEVGLEIAFSERYGRLKALYGDLDGAAFRRLVRGLRKRANRAREDARRDRLRLNGSDGSIHPILDQVVPPGSGNFSWSSIRPGVCVDLRERVEEVFYEYIGRHAGQGMRERVDDERLWRLVSEDPALKAVLAKVTKPRELRAPDDVSHRFRASWMNGRLQLAEPISLDYANPSGMVEEAVRWNGLLSLLSSAHDFGLTAIVTDPPEGDRQAAAKYEAATKVLGKAPAVRAVIPRSKISGLTNIILEDVHAAR